jgi:hypothetical protein
MKLKFILAAAAALLIAVQRPAGRPRTQQGAQPRRAAASWWSRAARGIPRSCVAASASSSRSGPSRSACCGRRAQRQQAWSAQRAAGAHFEANEREISPQPAAQREPGRAARAVRHRPAGGRRRRQPVRELADQHPVPGPPRVPAGPVRADGPDGAHCQRGGTREAVVRAAARGDRARQGRAHAARGGQHRRQPRDPPGGQGRRLQHRLRRQVPFLRTGHRHRVASWCASPTSAASSRAPPACVKAPGRLRALRPGRHPRADPLAAHPAAEPARAHRPGRRDRLPDHRAGHSRPAAGPSAWSP